MSARLLIYTLEAENKTDPNRFFTVYSSSATKNDTMQHCVIPQLFQSHDCKEYSKSILLYFVRLSGIKTSMRLGLGSVNLKKKKLMTNPSVLLPYFIKYSAHFFHGK